jgi:CMP/dCMP kinase
VKPPVITIDGPAGSGKTTLGRRLATTLGLPLVDTGLFYRGVTVAAARAGIGPDDREALVDCARQTVVVIDTDPTHDDADRAASVDGIEAGPALRDPANAPLLASISSIPEIRALLLDAQRGLAREGAVAVGRDCGTVVFPEAQLKLYLDASEALRSQRRASQLNGGADADSALMRGEVGARDRLDASRSAAPMRPAPDAHVLDTGELGIDEVMHTALQLWASVAGATGAHSPAGKPPPA